MATSGSFDTSKYDNTKWLHFSWSVKTKDAANNKTTIEYTLAGKGTDSGYHNAKDFKLVINGTTVYSSSTKIQLRNGTVVKTGTATIAHNADGTKSFSVSAEAAIYTGSVNCKGSKTFTLDSYDRKCVITAADGFKMNSGSPKITFTNPSKGKMDKLQLKIMIYDNSEYSDYPTPVQLIANRDITKTATSYTYTFTSSEWSTIKNKCNSGYTYNATKVQYVLTTTFGSTSFTSTKTATLSDADSTTPTASLEITEKNSAVAACFPTSKKIVKGVSDIDIKVVPSLKLGASLNAGSYFTNEYRYKDEVNKKYSWGGAVNETWYQIRLIDSRYRTKYYNSNLSVIDYFFPTAKLHIDEFTMENKIKFSVSGTYKPFTCDNGSTNAQAVTVQYRIHEATSGFNPKDATWPDAPWTNISVTKSSGTYNGSLTLTNKDFAKNWVIQFKVTDKLKTTISGYQYCRKFPVFDFNDEQMNINKRLNIREESYCAREGRSGQCLSKWEGSFSSEGMVFGYISSSNGALDLYIPTPLFFNTGQPIKNMDGNDTTKYFDLTELKLSVRVGTGARGGYLAPLYGTGSGEMSRYVFYERQVITGGAAVKNTMFDNTKGLADGKGFYCSKMHNGRGMRIRMYFKTPCTEMSTSTSENPSSTYIYSIGNNVPITGYATYTVNLLN